ncbi:MAG: hypothetical protein Pg6A_17270 [Termitinemataceae bacterium]|nr:MAG: hypothetical protein Pg6A_17270 [Termitinemataceae bacterium]
MGVEERTQVVVEFNQSAFKHGCTEADIRNAIGTWLYDDVWDTVTDKHLIIGFDTQGNLLEIMYNIKGGETLNVFHAMKCRNTYLRLLAPR